LGVWVVGDLDSGVDAASPAGYTRNHDAPMQAADAHVDALTSKTLA